MFNTIYSINNLIKLKCISYYYLNNIIETYNK